MCGLCYSLCLTWINAPGFCLSCRPLLFSTVLNVRLCLTPTGSGVGRFVGCAATDCTSFYAVIPSPHANNPDILYTFILAFCAPVPPIQFLEGGGGARTHTHARSHTAAAAGRSSNVTSLSLHSLIIRGDGWFSGFLRIPAECYLMRADSSPAARLPSALPLRTHSRLAHPERGGAAGASIRHTVHSPCT